MRTPVIAVWAAVLLTYGVSTGTAMDPKAGVGPLARASTRALARALAGGVTGPLAEANDISKLDMAPNSVDDMYDGCKDKMELKLHEYLENETNTNSLFKEAWESSEIKYQVFHPNERHEEKQKRHIKAILCYTSEIPKVYSVFNNAVRTQKNNYSGEFGYHALHFLLTDAIQTLTQNKCVTVYRCDKRAYTEVKNHTGFRFGFFASSSKDDYHSEFGNKTCFKIETCFGADISEYSFFKHESEVLIPPYEVFKVVGVKKRPQYKDFPCEVEYELKSNRSRSDLNCALF